MAAPQSLWSLARSCSHPHAHAGLRVSAAAAFVQIASFSTTPIVLQPAPKAKKAGASLATKGKKSLTLGKHKKQITEKKRTPPGAYKALKKRIVLSNTNALPVKGLKQLDKKSLDSPDTQGQVMELSTDLIDKLRAAEAFKPTQGWKSFRHPCVMMTEEAVKMAQHVKRIGQPSLNPEIEAETLRTIICGERGCGKSLLLLQSMAAAFLKGWIVLNLPEAREITDANQPYYPLPNAAPFEYVQKDYMAALLQQMDTANPEFFSKRQLRLQHDFSAVTLPKGTTLSRLCQLGMQNHDLAWSMFKAIWAEITTKSEDNPPILFALDGLSFAMSDSNYVNPDVKPIHAHELSIIKHFVKYLSGEEDLPNGGIIVAATTNSYAPPVKAMDYAIKVNEARQHDVVLPPWDPYTAVDTRVTNAMQNLDIVRMRGLTKDEARTILNYYAASGMLRNAVDEKYVSHNWTLSGGGIIGEIERAAVRMGIARI